MLIELGEKHSFTFGANWPVEARMLLWTTGHALIFVFVNYLAVWLGPGVGNMVRGFVDNLSTGKVPQPVVDANGNITVPPAVAPEGISTVMGLPVPSIAQGISSMIRNGQNNSSEVKKDSGGKVKKRNRPLFQE